MSAASVNLNADGESEISASPAEIAGLRARVAELEDALRDYERVKDQLRQSETLRAHADRMGNLGHWTWDEIENRCSYCSKEVATIHGLSVEEYLASRGGYEEYMAAVHPDDRQCYHATVAADVPTGAFYEVEYRIITAQGQVRHLREAGEPIHRADGTLVRTIGTLQDITAIREFQATAEHSKQRFRSAFEEGAVGVAVADPNGRLQDVNAALCEFLGRRDDELLECDLREIIHTEDRHGCEEKLQALLSGTARSYQVEKAYRHKDGYRVWGLVSVAAVHGAAVQGDEGQTQGLIAQIQDITTRIDAERELRAAKEQAEAASQTKSQFLANMSHELRTPLNAVIGFSEIIKSGLLSPDDRVKYREYANDIYVSGRHLLELINDILDLSRVESGHMDLTRSRTSLAALAHSALRFVKDGAYDAGIELDVALAPDAPPIEVDERKIKQVLINLLNNAVKFTPAGGRVRLEAEIEADGTALFRVVDSGVGMTDQEIEIALQLFCQVDGSLTRRHDGAGLGLPLSKALVELHGGTMRLDSAPGLGTTISVRLPGACPHDRHGGGDLPQDLGAQGAMAAASSAA